MRRNKNDKTALRYFTENLDVPVSSYRAYYNLACYYANSENVEKAIEFLEKAIQKGMKNIKIIQSDPYLVFIRNTDAFKNLISRYFPDYK